MSDRRLRAPTGTAAPARSRSGRGCPSAASAAPTASAARRSGGSIFMLALITGTAR